MDPLKKPSQGSALDRIENTLYDPKKKPDDFMMHQSRDKVAKELPSSWGDTTAVITPTTIKEKTSLGVKLLIVSSILLVASLSFTAWRVLSSQNVISSDNIDIALQVSPYIEGGEDTPLYVTLTNKNKVSLDVSSLTVMYKKGVSAQDEEEKVNDKKDTGSIIAGGQINQTFMVSLFGSEGESRDIIVKFDYKVPGSNAVFSKTVSTSVTMKTPPVAVSIDGPPTLSVGQEGVFSFSVKNNTASSTKENLLALTLPNSFVVTNASPKALSRSTSFVVPPLESGKIYTVTVTGAFNGTEGEVTTMKAIVGPEGTTPTAVGIVYGTQTYDVKLRTSPLLVTVSLNTDRGVSDSLRYGDIANLTIAYKNTTETLIKDIDISVALQGEAIIDKDIQPESGYYDSVKRVITWDASILPDFGTLQPQAEKTLRVRVPIVLKGNNSPKLVLAINGNGTLVTKNDIVTKVQKSYAVQGSASVQALATYKNSPAPNLGPIPPVVNTDTTYNARVIVSAQNALSDASVTFSLPVYVTWRSIVAGNLDVTYDPRSRLVTWNIGKMEAGKTITLNAGLTFKPSQSQVGQIPPLTSAVILNATEEVSRASIRTTISPITTSIAGEVWPVDEARVVDR